MRWQQCENSVWEHSVRDLASMNQSLREHIWSLEAEHENLSSAASCQSHSADSIPRGMRDGSGLQQHIDSLKSELGSARGELCAVKEQFDVMKNKLHHALHDAESVSRNHESPQCFGGNQNTALAQICPVLASIARQMQHMCQETDTRKRSDACHMVLEELERTRSWCRQGATRVKATRCYCGEAACRYAWRYICRLFSEICRHFGRA